ncbi:Spo0E like sporulation regulatory protein [Caldanaerobius fijiensis DSM 17918]|uniref:Spo0E like sporulation regulatory protein n=1 Tax=Caldanaerobius fijiensis DSM 17918 TaxID=1121256 RepID=A0A1M4SH94_9THEO|nr:Spo0E family sporulation regulatory protein-aspartic acid phosphatase [Caldanaerobius fijiensis]SHE31634.1 Spo0E like sporulation regulatory protein [Caldanaerobius fijiensis DSM 17918]
MDELQLKKEIANLREELDKFISGPKDKEYSRRLLQLSQKLDALIMAYYKQYKGKLYS